MELNPVNIFSPLSTVHPLNTETEIVAPLPRREIKIDMSVNWLALVLLGIVALILAGTWFRRRERRRLRKEWSDFKDELVAHRTVVEESNKPECQSCSNFASCSMAGVTKCPLTTK